MLPKCAKHQSDTWHNKVPLIRGKIVHLGDYSHGWSNDHLLGLLSYRVAHLDQPTLEKSAGRSWRHHWHKRKAWQSNLPVKWQTSLARRHISSCSNTERHKSLTARWNITFERYCGTTWQALLDDDLRGFLRTTTKHSGACPSGLKLFNHGETLACSPPLMLHWLIWLVTM